MPQAKTTTRKYFTTLREAIPLTDLIEVQKKSYDWFFKDGLKELFDEISPIKDFIGRDLELYFLDYYLDLYLLLQLYHRVNKSVLEVSVAI